MNPRPGRDNESIEDPTYVTNSSPQEPNTPCGTASHDKSPPSTSKRRHLGDTTESEPAHKAHKPTPAHGAKPPQTQYTTAWALLNERRKTTTTEEERKSKHTLEKHLANIPYRYGTLAAPYLYYLIRKGCYDIAEGKIHDLRPDQYGNVDHQEHQDYARLQEIIQELIKHHRNKNE